MKQMVSRLACFGLVSLFSATASDQPFTTVGTLSQVKIMKNRDKAFFKIVKVQ